MQIVSSPHDARFTRVVEKSALVDKFVKLGFQNTVEFISFTTPYILMVVEVNNFHCVCML